MITVFDYSAWSLRYPDLASQVAQPTAQLYFNESELYCDNTATSIISNDSERAIILNMLTAHIAFLNAPLGGQPSSPLVGRIANATEGSVSVTAEMNVPDGSAQWFAQTKYGASAWQALAKYRSMQYRRGPVRRANPWGGRCV